MDRSKLASNFSERLNLKLKEFGLHSKRAESGVQLTELSKVAGVSYQMARKYSLGLALPEPDVAIKIAQWLNISSGWLIFGEDNQQNGNNHTCLVNIDKDLLAYILETTFKKFSLNHSQMNIVDYLLEVIYDASHLNTNPETTKQIIDMMLSSAQILNNDKVKKEAS